jgi:hypothetical protein
MDTYILLYLRNTMMLCILFTAILLVPSPHFCIQHAFLRMGNRIHAWRNAMANTLRKKGPQFLEIDMAKFDALDNEQA